MKLLCNNDSIQTAIKIIQNGGIIVFPTDTVYGIGCDPYNAKAVKRIFQIKNRNMKKPLPVLAFTKNEIEKIAIFDQKSAKLAEKIWPGPLTLILKLKDNNLKKSLNIEEKIAVRVPDNQCVRSILEKCSLLVGTSANIAGQKSVKDPNEIAEQIHYDLLLDGGRIKSGGESTIVEFKDSKMIIHREGVLTRKNILELF